MKPLPSTDTVIWYRQFWPWFIFGLPAVVVVASLITVYIAVNNPDPLVDGDYYKHGLNINEQLKTRAEHDQPVLPSSSSPSAASPPVTDSP